MPIRVLSAELVRDIIDSFGQITKLNLATNEISTIENLEQLTCLTKLNLFCNRLGPVVGCLDGLAPLMRLRELDISDNSITSLEPLSMASVSLESLEAANNAVAGVNQVSHLASLTALTELVLAGNPLASEEGYRQRALLLLPSLDALDRTPRENHESAGDGGRCSQLGGAPVMEGITPGRAESATPSGAEGPIISDSGATALSYDFGHGVVEGTQASSRTQHERFDRLVQADWADKLSEDSTGLPLSSSMQSTGPPAALGSVVSSRGYARNDRENNPVGTSEESGFSEAVTKGPLDVSELSFNGDLRAELFSREMDAAVETRLAASRVAALGFGVMDQEPGVVDARIRSENRDRQRAVAHVADSGMARAAWFPPPMAETPTPTRDLGHDHVHAEEHTPRPTVASVERKPPETRPALAALPIALGGAQSGSRWLSGHRDEPLSLLPSVALDTGSLALEETNTALFVSPRRDPWNQPDAKPATVVTHARQARGSHGISASSRADAPQVAFCGGNTDPDGNCGGRQSSRAATPRPQGGIEWASVSQNRRYATVPRGTPCGGVVARPVTLAAGDEKRTNITAADFHTALNSVDLAQQRSQPHYPGEGPRSIFAGAALSEAGALRSSLPWGGGPIAGRGEGGFGGGGDGGGSGGGAGAGVVTVDQKELVALRRENEDLRRQASLAERRCAALTEMQRLADDALSREHASLFPTPDSGATLNTIKTESGKGGSTNASQEESRKRSSHGGKKEDDEEAVMGGGVSRLLACWRGEVLKLLLQRGVAAEAAKEESRMGAQQALEERGARLRAEMEVKSLTQRALAAEAEAELLGIKLHQATEELRDNRTGRQAAEASTLGHAGAVRDLRQWVHGFVGRASEGFFEREALLARGVAKMEAFTQRLDQAAGRLQLLGTLLQHKEVQLRNSRAALAADRRVWLLERREREMAALSKSRSRGSQPKPRHPVLPPTAASDGKTGDGMSRSYVATMGDAEGTREAVSPLLEGLRPECEAVMRALFCRVDRLGTGAVRARRLLSVLRSDCGVSELMEAAVGGRRWAAALASMETSLCPAAHLDMPGYAGRDDPASERDPSAERDVTWGEFLLFFLPSTGPADDAYNAGLIPPPAPGSHGERGGDRLARVAGMAAAPASRGAVVTNSGMAGAKGRREVGFGAVSEDAAALLQMVVPSRWTAAGGASDGRGERGLAALSVGQLRREVLRLASERAFLLSLVREDGRLGRRRAEAVHDQYRHELRTLHERIGEIEILLKQAENRAGVEQERANAVEQELSRLREEMRHAEQGWKRQLDTHVEETAAALAKSSRESSQAATAARERLSRLEAEHALALRENGKASVRQRALERELARIKTSMQTEARLEKEALEERLREGESKLAVARRERNALLAALRDIQRRERPEHEPPPPSTPPYLQTSRGGTELGGTSSCARAKRSVESGERGAEVVDTLAPEELREGGSGEGDGSSRLRVGVKEKSVGGVSQTSGSAGRAASLTARLEVLALQTKRLLAERSDASRSSDDDSDSD